MAVASEIRLALARDSEAPRRARALADGLSGGCDDAVDNVRLMIDELVTNAVRFGREPIVVTIGAAHGPLHVEVTDAGSGPPPRAVHFDRLNHLGGFGFDFVETLSDAWGVRGSTVWFDVDGCWDLDAD
jgi:anti-sigma regulatory factor (Ser/Thr protein kinase)